MTATPLRRRLLLLAVAGILPLAIMAAIGLRALAQQQRTQVERVGLEFAGALATAVDAELRSSISVLESLATTVALDRGDLRGFQERAHRVLNTQPNWAAVFLGDPSGTRLVDTRFRAGGSLSPIADLDSFERTVRTRAPTVGNLATSPQGELLFAVRVPVVRNGAVRYVLSAVIRPEAILDVITHQRVPEDWVISIFDANGRRVARSRAHKENVGGQAAVSLQALMARGGDEGVGQTYALEGDRIYTSYSRLKGSGWSAVPGIPAALVEGPRYRSLAIYGGGIMLSIIAGTLAALGVARSINRPIHDLRALAQSLGRREAPKPPDTPIQEIRDVAAALVAASDERTRAEAQREELLRSTEAARAAAEAAERKASFLAEVSAILGSSLDYDTTLVRVARLATPMLADLCAIDLLEEDGTTRRVAAAHIDAAKEKLVRGVRTRHGFNAHAPSGVPAVIRSRQPAFVASATDADLVAAARNPEQLAMFHALGLKSWIIVPLIARDQILGAMTLVITESDRRYAPVDLAFAESVATRAALAIDNVRLYREAHGARVTAETASRDAQRAQREAEVFASVTAEITTSLELHAVLEHVVNGAKELCDADIARIALREPVTDEMLFRYWVGSRLGDRHPVRVERGMGLGGYVWQTGKPYRTDDHRQDPHRHPGYEKLLTEEGSRASLVVPIRLGDQVEGVIFLDNRASRAFTAHDENLVGRFADHAAVAIQNARSLAAEKVARAGAEAGNRAKDEFLAVLSHELRTPLNAVYGWARMLQAGQIPKDRAQHALEAIVRNADAQVQLIDDLLDVSRVVTGKMRLDVRPVDLTTVIEAALDAVRPAAEAKGVRLQSVLDPRAGPVTGDPSRLQQVVWNLLINAVKFTPKGGRVQVHLQRVNSHVEIVVSDTGQGIAADVLPFIFDRFRQADSSSTRAHRGLGLGLALAKHLIELHGGGLTAQSPGEGKGATFIVKLPLTIAKITEGPVPRLHPTAAPLDLPTAVARLDGLRLLVVDDDPDALDLASAILTRAGATVRTASAAPEALELVQQWRPDVLVSDIEMPGEDGYSLIRKVRALDADQGGKTPAIALTAYGRPQDRIVSLTAGYSMHVPKPVDPGEFTAIVASVVARPLKTSELPRRDER